MIGREGEWATWEVNSVVRGGEGSKGGEQVAGQSWVRILSALKMDVIRSSEMLVHTKTTRCHVPEKDILPCVGILSQDVNVSKYSRESGRQ
jgi:hypothetical protein